MAKKKSTKMMPAYMRPVVKPTKRKKVSMNRTSFYRVLAFIIFFILAAIYIYDVFSKVPNQPTYSANQNEEGFYYYTYVDPNDYYYSANDLVKEQLKSTLYTILNDTMDAKAYGLAKVVLAEADLSIEQPNFVRNIYDGKLVSATWDAYSWNREHVWPNSRLGIPRVSDSSINQGSDLHNLRAITPSVNSSKGDRYFKAGEGDAKTVTGGGYYPGDDDRGDVARILFYMATMYDFLILTDDDDLLSDTSGHYNLEGARMGKLSLLLLWHKEDPVDEFERRRNQVIYEAQGNRNPFIDKPEYVHLIWEDKTISELILPEEMHQKSFTVFKMIMEVQIF
jgi:endonuclease I